MPQPRRTTLDAPPASLEGARPPAAYPATSVASPPALRRFFTRRAEDPAAAIEWQRRDAVIVGEGGRPVFEQRDVEVPASWSETAANIVASKYFRGAPGSDGRESSVRALVARVVGTLTTWGEAGGYFADAAEAATFADELSHLLLHQMASFNSPVWFNVGVDPRPQCSACFINSVEDTMESILDLAKTEAMLFKHGSGAGSNLSPLRSSREALSGGGTASGPVSFMKGYDAFAGVIKSGGKTRRAAKMVILDIDHPDIVDFIRAKEEEEKKARSLVAAGYDPGFDSPGGAYDSVFFQNANHSVRVSDAFMEAVVAGGEWTTRAVTTGEPVDRYPARQLLDQMARAAWECGDPGVQFDTTINAWHTCPQSGRIEASNPCSEYMFLDDSACNLASLNLLSFYDPDGPAATGGFAVEAFEQACRVLVTAMEIIVGNAGYPAPKITETSRRFRPLGLGYANLGALLMARGLPYDSDGGRAYAAALTALLSGVGYARSAEIAAHLGSFEGFAANREPMLAVLRRHRQAVEEIDAGDLPAPLLAAARRSWDRALALGETSGFRNAQISVLAPTGTIAFMMDCDTTGIEPELALVKHKRLVGGGVLQIVNRTVPTALRQLGYASEACDRIVAFVKEAGTIEGAPGLDPAHLPVFDCALRPARGERSIAPRGHLRMLAAVQPFLSGAISKTINLAEKTPPEEIADIFVEAWRLGLKAVAVYRDGCKTSQPLSTAKSAAQPAAGRLAARQRLPDERRALTHKFSIGEHEGYITVGLYEDGRPGEIFLVMAKEGSTISGLMDAFATAISIALQYGVPLQTLVDKFSHSRFEPCGFTQNPEIPYAKSIMDYIFRWLASRFLDEEAQRAAGVVRRDPPGEGPAMSAPAVLLQQDAPPCPECGLIMVRNGTCYKCLNCGTTSGCS